MGGMKNLLLLGKNVEIISLKLADETAALSDELGRLWLDLCFNEQALLIDQTEVRDDHFLAFKEILASHFQVLTSSQDLLAETWYELRLGQQTKLLRPAESQRVFDEPEFYPDWLVLDRSVRLSHDDQRRLIDYLVGSTVVKLATINSWSPILLEQADLLLFERSHIDPATIQGWIRQAKLSGSRSLAVITPDACYLADEQRLVQIKRLSQVSTDELWSYLLKLADYGLDAEDQAKALVWLMDQTVSGRKIKWSDLMVAIADQDPVSLLFGDLDYSKKMSAQIQQWRQTKLPWIDLSQAEQLTATEYSQCISNLLSTKALNELVAVILLDSRIKPTQLARLSDLPSLGVRLSTGFETLPGFEQELVTKGLDDLAERLTAYQQAGCRLALWSIKYRLSASVPHDASILSNSHIAARFAKLVQAAGLLPVVQLLISASETSKLNNLIQSLILEMDLLGVDLSNLIILVSAPGLQAAQAKIDSSLPALLLWQDDVVASIGCWAKMFDQVCDHVPTDETTAQAARTEFARLLTELA